MKTYCVRSRDGGFSLIELLITISVIILTAAMAVPSISDWVPFYCLTGDTRAIAGLMQKARLEAIKMNQAVSMQFVNTEPDSCVVYIDTNSNGTYDAGTDTLIESYNLNQRIDYGTDATQDTSGGSGTPPAISFAGNNAVFNPDGTATAGDRYLQFDGSVVDAHNKSRAVNVDTGGTVRVMTWKSCEGKWDDS